METAHNTRQHHDSNHIYSQQFVSFFCGCESFFFPSMSKRAGEFSLDRPSAKQKPVHCAAMIAKTINDKNVDMDYHAVVPPGYRAGGDFKCEDLCKQHPETFTKTATGASSSSGLMVATGATSSSGRPVALRTPLNTGEGKFIFRQALMEEIISDVQSDIQQYL